MAFTVQHFGNIWGPYIEPAACKALSHRPSQAHTPTHPRTHTRTQKGKSLVSHSNKHARHPKTKQQKLVFVEFEHLSPTNPSI